MAAASKCGSQQNIGQTNAITLAKNDRFRCFHFGRRIGCAAKVRATLFLVSGHLLCDHYCHAIHRLAALDKICLPAHEVCGHRDEKQAATEFYAARLAIELANEIAPGSRAIGRCSEHYDCIVSFSSAAEDTYSSFGSWNRANF
jgi:hypothetical protein